MTIETLQTICHKLPGVTEDIKLGEHLCFNVGGKSFLFTHPDGVPPSASFKVPAEDFEEIISKEGLEPQPYIARYKWVLARDISSLGQKEWEHYIQQSYRLIADKLPGKLKRSWGGNIKGEAVAKLKLLVIRTGDMQKLVGFYALLGFTFHYHQHGNSPYHYSATIDGTVIEIYPLTKSQSEADRNLRLGFELDDFDVVISSLKEAEVQFISEPAQTDFGFMAVVVDPDGRRIELYKK